MKNSKLFLFIVAFYFLISGVLHFVRLALNWDIYLGNHFVQQWVSALCIIISVIIVYWVYRIKKEETKKVNKIEVQNKEKGEEEE